jgi:hypothetical protein
MLLNEELKKFVEENPRLVTRKESKNYPGLFVLKYNNRVFYDGLWGMNDFLKECRGLVVDADYNIIVKPFTKVFNYGIEEEAPTIDPHEICTVVRKINGFMACVTKNTKVSPDRLIISTTGSLDSDFAELAATHFNLDKMFDEMFDFETFIFEICDETDPHIIKEDLGAYLIGGNYMAEPYNEYNLNIIANGFQFKRPEVTELLFREAQKAVRTVKHEGFMVHTPKATVKLKSPYYLITKFLARLKNEVRMSHILGKGDIKEVMKNFDEEYYPLIQHIRAKGDYFKQMDEQQRIAFIRNYFEGRE